MASPEGFNPQSEQPKPEDLEEVNSLIEDFKGTLKTIPEFRQAAAKKFLPDPEFALPNEVDEIIDTYFSRDPSKGFKSLLADYTDSLPEDYDKNITFKTNNSLYSVSFSQASESECLSFWKNPASESHESIMLVPQNYEGACYYQERQDRMPYVVYGRPAIQKAKELLNSLKPTHGVK
jgi:hypothetical protein